MYVEIHVLFCDDHDDDSMRSNDLLVTIDANDVIYMHLIHHKNDDI